MAQKLVTILGQFTVVGEVIKLDIPNLSETMELRLDHRATQIRIVMLMSDDSIQSTHPRYFTMIPDGDLPTNYKKFIGQRSMLGQTVNIVEVTAPV